jgi:hypothetical protein
MPKGRSAKVSPSFDKKKCTTKLPNVKAKSSWPEIVHMSLVVQNIGLSVGILLSSFLYCGHPKKGSRTLVLELEGSMRK